jgi:hypothetical protein
MSDANGPYNGHNDGTFDNITGKVRAPWVIWIDVEIRDASISLAERGAKLGQERVAIPTGRQRRLGWRISGHDTQPLFTASIQDNVAGVERDGDDKLQPIWHRSDRQTRRYSLGQHGMAGDGRTDQ